MHILETYALISGCKISKCFINEDPIELPSSNYITFHPHSGKGNSKQYDKWNIVLNLLNADTSFTHEIIQIGGYDDIKHTDNTSYLGQTNTWQLAYLIKNSSLHLGYDSFPIHIASFYDIPIVGLYSYYASTCGPYFSSHNRVRLFEPNFTNIKPTFGYNDPHKLINTIDPKEIYKSVIELLELKNEY